MKLLGIIFILIFTALMFLDMYFHTKESYGFELKWWYIGLGYFTGLILYVMPREKIQAKLTRIFEALIGKIK